MSKFDELKATAQAATEIIGKTHPEIEAATAAFKQIVTPGAVAELLAIQAQLVEALQLMLNTGGSFGKRVEAVNKTNAALAAAGAQP